MPKRIDDGKDGWPVFEATESEKAAREVWAKDLIASVPDGQKLVFESINECGHLDLETGEWVTDHYSEECYELPPRIPG